MSVDESNDQYPPGITLQRTLKSPSGVRNRISWSPDGEMLAAPSQDAVIVWNTSTGELLPPLKIKTTLKKTKKSKSENPFNRFYCTAWSFDGSVLAAGGDEYIYGWYVPTGTLLWNAEINLSSALELAWSINNKTIAAACNDGVVRIIDSSKGRVVHELRKHFRSVFTAALSPNGKLLVTASFDETISSWKAADWTLSKVVDANFIKIWQLAWSPDGKQIAMGGQDSTVKIWDIEKGQIVNILEGHTGPVRGVSFSFDGKLLASKSSDSLRIWRCDTWESVAVLPQLGHPLTFASLAFHPKLPILANDSEDGQVSLLKLDTEILLNESVARQSPAKSTRYSNARVVLVGDTGVGKSGLALVLTGKPWDKTDSTHGRRVWVFDNQVSENEAGLTEMQEVLLWDLAGQPDYRLIHQIHLTEVALALIVFDSRSQTDPFAGVRHWDRALRQAQRVQGDSIPATKKFLVAARADVGRVGVSPARIEIIKEDLNFDDYFETSAKEGWGVAELIEAIRESINWEILPKVSSTELFQNIKDFLVSEKESGRLLSTTEDLYRGFLNTHKPESPAEDLRSQFETCVGRVESRGLIQRLSFGDLVLLQPELQDVYASAMANAVKDDPDGLGCISEARARAGDFRLPESERIRDANQEKLLLISTVEELLRHEIALREQGEDGQYLVFPSQLTRENPDLPDPEGKAVVFYFEGPVLNVYATLAVRLSYSGIFKKKDMWKNAASYAASVGGVCGMFLREIEDGRGELTLFFSADASEETRFQFEEYINTHLTRRALTESIRRRRIFVCPECSTPVSDLAAKRRRERGFESIACNVCEPPVSISLMDREERLPLKRSSKITEMDKSADARRELETAASVLQGKIATKDFDVFLCHNSADKDEVKRVGERLKERGILPWLDEWELRPGLPWQRLLEEQIERIKSAAVFVGNDGVGPWQRQELDAFLREFVGRNCPVIPVVLPNAPKKPALPIFLKGMTWVDFRKDSPDPLMRLIWGITGNRSGLDYQAGLPLR